MHRIPTRAATPARARTVVGTVAILVVAGGILAVSWARSDEPGRLACPLTGEVVCRDRECPLFRTEMSFRHAARQAADALR